MCFWHLKRLAHTQLVPACPTVGKHWDDQRPGIARDADSARWQRRLATEKRHRQSVLKKVVINDKSGDLSPTQGVDDAAHTTWGWLDHGYAVGMPEMRDPIEHEPGGGSTGDDRHGHPQRGDGMPKQVECPHVRGCDDDSLPTLMGAAQDRDILGGDRHEG